MRAKGTYFCCGHTACTPSANSFACAKSGSLLSIQMQSAYGAYAIARVTAHPHPPLYL